MEIARLRLGGRETGVLLGDRSVLSEHTPDMVVCDAGVAGSPVLAAWDTRRIARTVLPPGEQAKQWVVLEALLRAFTERELTRSSHIAAVGGGAVTDLGAFAAGVYMRGIDVTLVPTTLLAMVDAAIGGKSGIDFVGYKNLVGTFHPADHVLIVPEFLDTLGEREYLSGLAEAIKAAMLGDDELFALFEHASERVLARDRETLRGVIARAVAVKAAVVNRDFTERGERAYLNLGHTFGHALEAVLGLGVATHGEAVAWGIGRALVLGERLGITDPRWAHRARALLIRYGYEIDIAGIDARAIVAAMRKDKKRRSGALVFVLQRGVGDTIVEEVEEREVIAVLESRG